MSKCRIAVDIGGTFTDLVMLEENGQLRMAKVPSTPPDYSAGVTHALSQVLDDFSEMRTFVHGTTAQLNAFLERKGARTALLTTKGFGDVYVMGRGSRIRMYDLHYRNAEPLVPRHLTFEVEERLDGAGNVIQPLNQEQLPQILDELKKRDIKSLAVCFLHSYLNPAHEEVVSDFFREQAPELFVSPSHRVCREWREFERTSTVVMNAYVSPILESYLRKLRKALEERGYDKKVYLMQSNGGLIQAAEAESRGVLTLMSGPVGGSVGSKALAKQMEEPNLICVDMGGTSFDVSLVVDGQVAVTSEKRLGGFPVLAPMVDLHTIGAGGGSIAWNDAGALRVGPQSAGAVPGPACYGRGGEVPTVTDANLVLGRINPETSLAGEVELLPDHSQEVVKKLGDQFGLSTEKMAEGMIDVVNAQMANAIRTVTISKGIDPRSFALVAFGGAGPMHAALIARELGVSRVLVPNVAGAFSAWGMLKTDLRHDVSQTFIEPMSKLDWKDLEGRFNKLEKDLGLVLAAEEIPPDDMKFVRSLDMRYVGQEYFINVPLPEGLVLEKKAAPNLKKLFDELYGRAYGHKNLAEEIELVNLRVEAHGFLHAGEGAESKGVVSEDGSSGTAVTRSVIFDEEPVETKFVQRGSLKPGDAEDGPVIVEEQSCTTVVPPDFRLSMDDHWNLVIERKEKTP